MYWNLGRHRVYPTGERRPLFRGWLHGAVTPLAIIYTCHHAIFEKAHLCCIVPLASICFALFSSSLLHLYPFVTVRAWESARRVDRMCIFAVCETVYFSPQLTVKPQCKPPLALSLWTVVMPCTMATLRVLAGSRGPDVFAAVAFAATPTTVFWVTYDVTMAVYSLLAILMFAAGLSLHMLHPARPAKRWGHHEWAHVFVTLGLAISAQGVLRLSHTCL